MGGGQSAVPDTVSSLFNYDCNTHVAQFINSRPHHFAELSKIISNYAYVQSISSNGGTGILALKAKINVTTSGRDDCKQKLDDFFNGYLSFQEQLESFILRSTLHGILYTRGLDCDIIENTLQNSVQITGLAEDVKTMISLLRDAQAPPPNEVTQSRSATSISKLSVSSTQSNVSSSPSTSKVQLTTAPLVSTTNLIHLNVDANLNASTFSNASNHASQTPSALPSNGDQKCLSTYMVFKFQAPDYGVARYIKYSEEHTSQLVKAISSLAKVEIHQLKNKSPLEYHFRPAQNILMTEEDFNSNCEEMLKKFLSKYSSRRVYFNSQHLKKVSAKAPNFFENKSTSENNGVYVQWHLSDHLVFLAGVKIDVDKKVKEIQQFLDTTAPRPLPSNFQFKMLARDFSIARFLQHSKIHSAELKDLLKEYATFKFWNINVENESRKSIQYVCKPLPDCELTENEFDSKCETILSNFLEKFSCQKKFFNHDHLMKVAEKIPGYFKPQTAQEREMLFVEWRLDKNRVLVVGLRDDVEKKLQVVTNFLHSSIPRSIKHAYEFHIDPPNLPVARFIKQKESHLASLRNDLKDAKVWITPRNQIHLKATVELAQLDIPGFEKKCKLVVTRFFRKYDSWSQPYPLPVIKSFERSYSNLLSNHHPDWKVEISKGNELVLVGIKPDFFEAKKNILEALEQTHNNQPQRSSSQTPNHRASDFEVFSAPLPRSESLNDLSGQYRQLQPYIYEPRAKANQNILKHIFQSPMDISILRQAVGPFITFDIFPDADNPKRITFYPPSGPQFDPHYYSHQLPLNFVNFLGGFLVCRKKCEPTGEQDAVMAVYRIGHQRKVPEKVISIHRDGVFLNIIGPRNVIKEISDEIGGINCEGERVSLKMVQHPHQDRKCSTSSLPDQNQPKHFQKSPSRTHATTKGPKVQVTKQKKKDVQVTNQKKKDVQVTKQRKKDEQVTKQKSKDSKNDSKKESQKKSAGPNSSKAESKLPYLVYTPKKIFQPMLKFAWENSRFCQEMKSRCKDFCILSGTSEQLKVEPVNPEENDGSFFKKAMEQIQAYLSSIVIIFIPLDAHLIKHFRDNEEEWARKNLDSSDWVVISWKDDGIDLKGFEDDVERCRLIIERELQDMASSMKTNTDMCSSNAIVPNMQETKQKKKDSKNELPKKSAGPNSMVYTPKKIFEPMIKFAWENSRFCQEMKSRCKDLCILSGTSKHLKVEPVNPEGNDGSFFITAMEQIEAYLSSIVIIFIPLDAHLIKYFRDNEEEWARKNLDPSDWAVISWKDNGIDLKGFKDDVEKYKLIIEGQLQEATVTTKASTEVCRVLVTCGVIAEANRQLEKRVHIVCSIEQGTITFSGKECFIEEAKAKLGEVGKLVEEPPTLVIQQLVTLKEMLSKGKIFAAYVEEKFAEKNIKCVLMLESGKLILTAMTREMFKKGSKFLDSLLQTVEIPLPKSISKEIYAQKAWKDLHHEITNDVPVVVSEELTSVILSGLHRESLQDADSKVRRFFEQSMTSAREVSCKPHVCRFIIKYFPSSSLKLAQSQHGLKVDGPTQEVDKFVDTLRCITWSRSQLNFSALGLLAHFSTSNWKDFVKVLEHDVRCSVDCDTTKCTSPEKEEFIASQSPHRHGDFDKASVKEAVFGSVNVTVCHGDITADASDIIINGVISREFDLRRGAVSSALLKRAGLQMQEECKSANHGSPVMRHTRGWNLLCNHVIHIVTPNDADQLTKRINDALDHAELLRAKSVALPTLGAGGIGIAAVDVSTSMSKAFELFALSKPRYVEKIRVVVYDKSLVDLFLTNIVQTKDLMGAGKRTREVAEAKMKSMLADEAVILVNTDDPTNSQIAKQKIDQHMTGVIMTKTISEEVVTELDEHDLCDIYDASYRHKVAVTFNHQGSEVIARGMNSNVIAFYDVIRELLFELREAITISKMYVWKWASSADIFNALPLRVSRAIEKEYETNKNGSTQVNMYGSSFLINFSKMTYDFKTITGKIKREGCDQTPIGWTDMMRKPWIKVPLDEYSSEYNRVCNLFKASNPKVQSIASIERVQNPALFKHFLITKNEVERHMRSKQPVERELFHGTSQTDAAKICADGFNRSYAGKNATVYGKGCYFAAQSSYSVNYAGDVSGGKKCIFLARVLTGDFCKGTSSMLSAPEKRLSGDTSRKYDSVVDDENNPSIFVVFTDSSVYPSYLLTFY